MSGIGEKFQQETKYRADQLQRAPVRWTARPDPYKTYPEGVKVVLPSPEVEGRRTVDDVLNERRSVRRFRPESISLDRLSYLIWASTGIQRTERGYEFRTAPSAGALYPIETYIVAHRVRDLEAGVYHYGIRNHELERIRSGDMRVAAVAAALGQEMCGEAAAVFAWTAIFARSQWKYGERAYRYVYLDAGHIAENLALAAVSLGLGSCQVGALLDDEVNRLLEVDGADESVVYMSAVGVPA
ncbi:MAG: SagB/ThcOx family dehydrogenase [Sedimentisphaerales bacterium]|nr:SagB/ThcOx family dehydrogenase [Sedimentisphaerales bacterium]